MKIINNITDKLSDELKEKLEPGSKLSIAAACFSVYAFEELKTQLEGIDALRFIFTSPTFLAEQPEKAQREFYIPRLNREKTLYGSEFEIRLRNEFTQKAISRECAEWVRRKASFKSNVTSELMPGFMTVENAAPCAFAPVNGFTRADLGCERGGNMFSMINEIDAPESAAYLDENLNQRPKSIMSDDQRPDSSMMQEFNTPFDNPKQLAFIKRVTGIADDDSIILDFFSGSATTAHAVMQLNAEDGGHRKFIMVQLPEKCDEASEAYKVGYKTICEIGKERIRRAGDKIKAEHPDAQLDTGFRVFRVDESNMEDVYYHPEELTQTMLGGMVSNIKSDRSDLDLLYACLLDWDVEINLPHSAETLDGCTIHNVDDGALVACFDENVPDTVIRRMADLHPLRAVFRDSSFANDDSKINVTEIFKNLSPDTNVKVI